MLQAAVAGVSGLGANVLVATGPNVDPALLGDLPVGVVARGWVPQATVLEQAALVVHHGGAGTTFGCAAAGVPQLIMPQGADQFGNAEMIIAAGCGGSLAYGSVTPDAVREAATSLLGDEAVRNAALALAGEIASMPAPSEVAAQLETIVSDLRS